MNTQTLTPKATDVDSIYVLAGRTDASVGRVQWIPAKSLWTTTMYLTAAVGGALTVSLENVLVFLFTSAVTLCLGHSLGMHRRLIHQSYECPKWLEYLLVHLGVVVGLAGPRGMAQAHDTRDWAQRQARCHPYFSQHSHPLKDWWWQLHCHVQLRYPPIFKPSALLANDKVYRFMERYWMLQQLPWALLLWAIGGWSWVIWGIAVRVAVSITGHWLIGYLAHNHGHRHWHVRGASAQGYNVRFCGWITFGECWHNNHHAFPGSAKLGLETGQSDPGWWVLCILQKLGLVRQLRLPQHLAPRPALEVLHD